MTRPTMTLQGEKARKAVLDGVNAIALPVSKTLGPQARKALIYRTMGRGSRIVDDGHFVAEAQEPRNQFIRLAAGAFKEACKRTNEKVGDGTATTAVIGGRLMNEAYLLLTEGVSTMTKSSGGKIGVSTLRRQILAEAEEVIKQIKESKVEIKNLEDLERIAIISVGDEKVGKIVAKMAYDAGIDGFIDVVEGYKGEIETEISNGFRFPAKPGAKAFVNNPARYEMVMEDCPVLITNYALDNAAEISATLRKMNTGTNSHPGTSKIIVIAPSFSDSVLINMVNAVKQGGYFIHPVKVPSLRTDQFEDLAVYCGAKFVDKNKGMSLKSLMPSELGFIEKLIVKDTETREDAVATGGRGTIDAHSSVAGNIDDSKVSSPVADRIITLKGQLAEQTSEPFRKLLERRIASMASSVGIIRVADSTQASSLDLKLKIEDAVYACKAALRGGYVKGGGLCLREIAEKMPDTSIIKGALLAPYETIQASVDGGMEIGDDVIDPAEAEICAVEHACGVVANLITVEIITIEVEDENPNQGMLALAQEVGRIALSMRQTQGQIHENEVEMEKDRLNGLTEDEVVTLDKITG